MQQTLALVAILVRDYDEAIEFFTTSLGFILSEDTELSEGKRWVVVTPKGAVGSSLLLARASTTDQLARIGDQTGGRVFLFLRTDNFWRDYLQMKSQGIKFLEEPRVESYGTVAVFFDLYGNRWDLLELNDKGNIR